MKKTILYLIILTAISSCKIDEKSNNNMQTILQNRDRENEIKKMAGFWVLDDFFKRVERTKQVYSDNFDTVGFIGYHIKEEDFEGEPALINGFTEHEGGIVLALRFDTVEKKFLYDFENENNMGIGKNMRFDIGFTKPNIMTFKYANSNKPKNFRRVLDEETELRRILFEGTYRNSEDGKIISFNKNGTVNGLKGRQYFQVTYDFEFSRFDEVAIQAHEKILPMQCFHFKIKDDTLKLFHIIEGDRQAENANSIENKIGDVWMTLLKEK